MNIRLEYSPQSGKFNQAKATDSINVEQGFQTLCCFVAADRASRFLQVIVLKYPELSDELAKRFPTFSVMKHELIEFIAEDLKQLERQMNNTYKRRIQILNT